MAIVIKGNCEKTIDEGLVDEYIKKGFSVVVRSSGAIRADADAGAMAMKLDTANATIKSLKAELATLKAELKAARGGAAGADDIADATAGATATTKADATAATKAPKPKRR